MMNSGTVTEFDIVTPKQEDVWALQEAGAAESSLSSLAVGGPRSQHTKPKGKSWAKLSAIVDIYITKKDIAVCKNVFFFLILLGGHKVRNCKIAHSGLSICHGTGVH